MKRYLIYAVVYGGAGIGIGIVLAYATQNSEGSLVQMLLSKTGPTTTEEVS